ncbi:MAG: GTPase [Thermoprotei archaeon]|nr:MAG: GTPase [Thermoprotei archaeon]RLF25301.1 MAG: GTPase [Thermoprotei archaeon]
MKSTIVVFLGPAGSGKSSLTAAFGRWLEEYMSYKVAYVNLDPGCDYVPYDPDYDIRKLVTVDEVMRRENLGPNGAVVRCMEIMLERAEGIVKEIGSLGAEYILVDTPGQMEPFAFRRTGPVILDMLRNIGPVIGVFIVDPELASSAPDLVVVYLLGVVIQIRLGVPTVIVVNKVDLVRDVEELDIMLTNIEYLKRAVESSGAGAIIDLADMCSDVIMKLAQAARVVKVSARTGYGMELLYDIIHEVFCTCGDLT